MNNIEYIERAILPEDFFPQYDNVYDNVYDNIYDNIYYKNLLRQYLYKIYKCKCSTKKEIDAIEQQILLYESPLTPPSPVISPTLAPSPAPAPVPAPLIIPAPAPAPPPAQPPAQPYLKYKGNKIDQIDYSKLERNVNELLDYYNNLVKIYTEIHNEKKQFEGLFQKILDIKRLELESLNTLELESLNKFDYQQTELPKMSDKTDYDKIKILLSLSKILIERINKLEMIIRKYLKSNLDFEKILPILDGGNSFTIVDDKLKDIKKLIDGLDFDLKNLLKFKSQVRVSEDEYLNMIKTMKVKLEKDAMNNPNKPYSIVMNDKELINLGDKLKIDGLENDDTIIKDIQEQISKTQDIGNFKRPTVLDFDFNTYNDYKDKLQNIYLNLQKILNIINKKIDDTLTINMNLIFIKKINYNEKKKEYDNELQINHNIILFAKFVFDNKELKQITDIQLNDLREKTKEANSNLNPNNYNINNNELFFKNEAAKPKNKLKIYFDLLSKSTPKLNVLVLLEKYKDAYRLLTTDYEKNIDQKRREINFNDIDKPFSEKFNIKDIYGLMKKIIINEEIFIKELKKYNIFPTLSGGSQTNFTILNTSLQNISELIDFTNKLKSVIYTFEIIKNISTNIEKTIENIKQNFFDYLNFVNIYNNILKNIIENKIQLNDFYYLSEIEDAKQKNILLPENNQNKLYKKLVINICKNFIKKLEMDDNNVILVDVNNYIYFYLINV